MSEIKYDGEYSLVIYNEDTEGLTCSCDCINKYGKSRTYFPAVDKIALECRAAGVKKAVFLAELYTDEGKVGALYDLLGRKEDDGLNISVFDACLIEFKSEHEFVNVGPQTPLIERLETYMNVLPSQRTQLKIVTTKEEAMQHFNEVVAQGYEGTVVKSLDGRLVFGPCLWVKLKNKDQSDYEVGFIDPVKERIEVLVPNPNANDPMLAERSDYDYRVQSRGGKGIIINVGVKVMNANKATLKVGDMVTIEHQGVLDSGSLRHPVFKGKVNSTGGK